ncbi:MAG: redoxin domain-containing protein [Mucilaginibacter sp.]|nr:redoxin domain-containing protein [Mucilaginibacter sp.]
MKYISVKPIRKVLLFFLLLFATSANGQISLINAMINKLDGYKSFSYCSINKLKDMSADTTVAYNQEIFLKSPDDKLFGYLYSIETDHKTEAFHRTDLYDGKKVTILSAADSTFFLENEPYVAFTRSLIGGLNFIRERYTDKPFKIIALADTVINGKENSHVVAEVYDVKEGKEHFYSYRHYFADKKTGLPSIVTIVGRYRYNGLISDYYSETVYQNFKFDQSEITPLTFTVPIGFKPRIASERLPLLAQGIKAPDWTLTDVNGKTVSLKQLKGKIVLLDFYFIGCSGCMLSVKPLNAVFKKYKKKNVFLASLTMRDSKKAVIDFESRNDIAYPGFINAAEVVKLYHVTAFPTFYIIDQYGKIAQAFVGYNDDLGQRITSVLENLLSEYK